MKAESISIRPAIPGDLKAVMEIVSAWPAHFVDAGKEMIVRDFAAHRSAVATIDGRVAGFLNWRTDGEEMELLWLAVAPDVVRCGVATALVKYVMQRATTERHVFLLTATTDSNIPGTAFEGQQFAATNAFFEKLRFAEEKVLPSYWGEQNHALQMGRSL